MLLALNCEPADESEVPLVPFGFQVKVIGAAEAALVPSSANPAAKAVEARMEDKRIVVLRFSGSVLPMNMQKVCQQK